RAANPAPTTELEHQSPLELLVAAMLSAHTTDKSVNAATRVLFPVANTPAAILPRGVEGLKPYIRSVGLYNTKAQNLIGLRQQLVERHARPAGSATCVSTGTRRRRSPHAGKAAAWRAQSLRNAARERAPGAGSGNAPARNEPPRSSSRRRRRPQQALLPRHVQVGERALDCLGRPRHRLGERGMRMNREPDVGGVATGLHRQRDLADQLAGVGAHDAATE